MQQKGRTLTFLCESNLDLTDQVAIGVIDDRLYVSADISTAPIDTNPNSPSNGCPTSIRIFSRRLFGAEPFEQLVDIPFRFTQNCESVECIRRPGAKTIHTIHLDHIYALAFGIYALDSLLQKRWHMFRICARTGVCQHFRSQPFRSTFYHCVNCIGNKMNFFSYLKNEETGSLQEKFILSDTKIVDKPNHLREFDYRHKVIGQQQFIIDMMAGELVRVTATSVRAPCCLFDLHYANPSKRLNSAYHVLHFGYCIFYHDNIRYVYRWDGKVLTILSEVKHDHPKAKIVSLRTQYSDNVLNVFHACERYIAGEERELTFYVTENGLEPSKLRQIRLRGDWLRLFPRGTNGVSSSSTFQLLDDRTAVMIQGRYICTIAADFVPLLRDLVALRLQSRWCTVTTETDPNIRVIRDGPPSNDIIRRLIDNFADEMVVEADDVDMMT